MKTYFKVLIQTWKVTLSWKRFARIFYICEFKQKMQRILIRAQIRIFLTSVKIICMIAMINHDFQFTLLAFALWTIEIVFSLPLLPGIERKRINQISILWPHENDTRITYTIAKFRMQIIYSILSSNSTIIKMMLNKAKKSQNEINKFSHIWSNIRISENFGLLSRTKCYISSAEKQIDLVLHSTWRTVVVRYTTEFK